MQRQIQLTEDGSHTVSIPNMHITYHSKYGAVQESMHVFIEPGLKPLLNHPTGVLPVGILDIGFGTGLNALLTWREAVHHQQSVHVTSIEPYPLLPQEYSLLNYGELLSMPKEFHQLHDCPWENPVQLDHFFSLEKKKISLLDYTTKDKFDCIYFDAFAPSVQPELWTQQVFEKLAGVLRHGGCLLTYCSKSVVRQAMTAAGFTVTKIQGPRGKREMVVSRIARI